MRQQLLVVLPHPDDESIVAGTLIKQIQAGAQVTYVCLTLGEMGRNMGIPLFASRATLPLIRKRELEEACRIIGIQDVRRWGMHDKTVEFEDREVWAERLKELIIDLRPAVIYTFYPGHAVHPDHDACGAIVVRAVELMEPSERPEVHCAAILPTSREVLGPPDIVNDVSEVVEQKVQAISAHQTQYQLMIGNANPQKVERFKKERLWRYRFV